VSGAGWLLVVTSVLSSAAGLHQIPAELRWVLLTAGGLALVRALRGGAELAGHSPERTAAVLEALAPSLERRIRPAVDLARRLVPGTSMELTELAQEQALERLDGIDPSRLLGTCAPLPWRPLALGTLLTLFATGASGGCPMPWARACLPWHDPPAPLPRLLTVAPGDTSVVAGSPVTVRCLVAWLRDEGAVVETRRPGEMDARLPLEPSGTPGPRTTLTATLRFPKGGYQYRVSAGPEVSPWFAVDQYHPLEITDARLTYHFPPYTGLDSMRLVGIPREIRGLRGTRVVLVLQGNNPLTECVCRLWCEPPCTMRVDERTADGEFTIERGAAAAFAVRDRMGQHASMGPVPVYMTADESPTIDALIPGCDTLLSRDVNALVGASAHDDFGLSLVAVRYTMGEREDTLVLAKGRMGTVGSWVRTWDLSPLGLLPEDIVSYRFEVTDNDAVSGPKRTASRWFRLRFPGLDEIMASIGQEQTSVIDSLEALSGEGNDLREELRSIAAELSGADAADWGTREDLKALAAEQRALGERLARAAEDLARIERMAEEEELFTAELLDRVATVQELLRTLRLPELDRALDELQHAVDTVNPRELEQALSRLADHQERILEGLDRAIQMLKRLEAAQRLSSLARTAERIEGEQENLVEAPKTGEQAGYEARLGEDLARLQEAMGDLTKDMRSVSTVVADSLAAASQRVQASGAQEAMEQAAGAMRSGSPDAPDLQAKALAGAQRLAADLQAAESSMGGQDLAQLMENLAAAERTVADLAYEQQQLAARPGDAAADHPRQVGVAEALRILREQTEETLAKGLGPAAADVLGTMARAQNELDRAAAQGSRGLKDRASALRALNTVSGSLSALRQNLQAMSCSDNSGMEELFGLSQAQGQLNQSCQSLLPRAGGLSREMLASLAARQQLIRDQLSRIGQGRQGDGSVTGDLGGIGREMEDLVSRLDQRGLDKDTVDRQRRVLSRLLDAQRSVRRQGLARRRMSEPARTQTTVPGEAPPPGVSMPVPAPPPRQDDAFPPAYRDAIEAYFRAISRPLP
jgi:hypothetical protein